MFACSYCSWNWVWINHPWALISQNWALNHIIPCVYKSFPENEPKRIGFELLTTWFWAWRCNLEFPDSALPLERGKCRSSVESEHPASLCTVLLSARAEDWALERRLSQARACVERRFHPSSTFTVRSSGKVYARACTFVSWPLERGNLRSSGTLFFWKFWNCFLIASLHPHPILGIVRPSLRHLNEDIVVEHAKAN